MAGGIHEWNRAGTRAETVTSGDASTHVSVLKSSSGKLHLASRRFPKISAATESGAFCGSPADLPHFLGTWGQSYWQRFPSTHLLSTTGRRNEKEDRPEYRFDVQNNEDVALNGQRSIRFNIRGSRRFSQLSLAPEYHVGCNAVRPTLSDDGKTLELHANEMPPHRLLDPSHLRRILGARDIQLEIVNEERGSRGRL